MLGEISAAIAPWNGNWVASSIGYSLVYSTLDNPRSPREGIRASTYPVLGWCWWRCKLHSKRMLLFLAYMPLSQDADIVAFGRVRGGHIQGLGNNTRVLDNYYQGSRAIRGFNSYRIWST